MSVSLFQSNDIDIEFAKLQIPENIVNSNNAQPQGEGIASTLKMGKFRRLLKKETKHQWLGVSNHSVFWSHVLLGSNEIIRRLENSVDNQREKINQIEEKKILCLFVDSGWLISQYGHHLANLCGLLNVRLAAIKPTGSLPELVTTKFKPVKKLAVFGFCSSMQIPSDLLNVCQILEGSFTVRDDNACAKSTDLVVEKEAPLCQMIKSSSEIPSVTGTKQSWDDVEINSNLYTYSSSVREFTLSEFQSYLSSFTHNSLGNHPHDALLDSGIHSHIAEGYHKMHQYKPPVLKAVVAQTVDQRENRKRKRRAARYTATSDLSPEMGAHSLIPVKKKKKKKEKMK